jgi:hypothetical protein
VEGGIAATNVVFLAELLAERGAHDGTSDAGWGIEMSLSRLAPRGVEGCIQSQFCALEFQLFPSRRMRRLSRLMGNIQLLIFVILASWVDEREGICRLSLSLFKKSVRKF